MVRMILDEGVDWTLFADPMSGLLDHPNTAPMEALLNVQPDAVLSIGGQWINKKPKQYLRSLGITKHVHVDVFQCWDVLDANVEHIRFSPNLAAALEICFEILFKFVLKGVRSYPPLVGC